MCHIMSFSHPSIMNPWQESIFLKLSSHLAAKDAVMNLAFHVLLAKHVSGPRVRCDRGRIGHLEEHGWRH